MIACDVVWAETASFFPAGEAMRSAMVRLGVEFTSLSAQGSEMAGAAFKVYRHRGGRRQRVVADFLIGGHAVAQSDRLLTRDRGFYRAYFRKLKVLDPSLDT